MKKVILTKEQHEALSGNIIDFEVCISNKIKGFENDRNKCLNELSIKDFASALINGYEVEETKQERILRLHRIVNNSKGITQDYKDGWNDCLSDILDILKLDIKGEDY